MRLGSTLTSQVRPFIAVAFPITDILCQVTYSDLSDGYEPVARGVEAIPEQRNGETVYVAKHWVQYREDPDSVAAIVVSSSTFVTPLG